MTLLGQKQMAYVGILPLLWGPTAPFYKNWHNMFKGCFFLHFMGEGLTNYTCLFFSVYKNYVFATTIIKNILDYQQ